MNSMSDRSSISPRQGRGGAGAFGSVPLQRLVRAGDFGDNDADGGLNMAQSADPKQTANLEEALRCVLPRKGVVANEEVTGGCSKWCGGRWKATLHASARAGQRPPPERERLRLNIVFFPSPESRSRGKGEVPLVSAALRAG